MFVLGQAAVAVTAGSLSRSALAPAYIAPVARVDTWTIWAYPVALSTTLLVGTALASLGQALMVSSAMSIAYTASVSSPCSATRPCG